MPKSLLLAARKVTMNEFLKMLPLFATFAPSALARLAQKVEGVQPPGGAQIFVEGAFDAFAYLVHTSE